MDKKKLAQSEVKEILETLSRDEDVSIRKLVAENKNTPELALRRLCNNPDTWVEASSNPSLPKDLILSLVTLMKGLKEDIDDRLPVGIAMNPALSEKQMEELATCKCWVVKDLLVQNPNITSKILGIIVRNSPDITRMWVAYDQRLSLETIEFLSHDPLYLVRRNLTCNSKTPIEILKRLLHDDNEDVRESAKKYLSQREV